MVLVMYDFNCCLDTPVRRGDRIPQTSCTAVKPLIDWMPSVCPSMAWRNSPKDLLSSFTGFKESIFDK